MISAHAREAKLSEKAGEQPCRRGVKKLLVCSGPIKSWYLCVSSLGRASSVAHRKGLPIDAHRVIKC